MKKHILGIILAVSCSFYTTASYAQTSSPFLVMSMSQAHDESELKTNLFTDENASLHMIEEGLGNKGTVDFLVDDSLVDDNRNYSFAFGSAGDLKLEMGLYQNATRAAKFNSSLNRPLIDFKVTQSTNGLVEGRFFINQISYRESGEIDSIDVSMLAYYKKFNGEKYNQTLARIIVGKGVAQAKALSLEELQLETIRPFFK